MKKVAILMLFLCWFLCGCAGGISFNQIKLEHINSFEGQKVYFFRNYEQYAEYVGNISAEHQLTEPFADRLNAYKEGYFTNNYLVLFFYRGPSTDSVKIKRILLIDNTASLEVKVKDRRASSADINQRVFFVEIEKVYDIIDASVKYI